MPFGPKDTSSDGNPLMIYWPLVIQAAIFIMVSLLLLMPALALVGLCYATGLDSFEVVKVDVVVLFYL